MLPSDVIRHRAEFARALDNNRFEITPAGVLFPQQHMLVAGAFTTKINGRDAQHDPNIVPTAAIADLLKAFWKGSGGSANWWIAPFTNNVSPLATLTPTNFNSTLAEWTTYNEATRQAYTLPADPAGGVFSNSAAPAVFTAAGAVTVFGAAILSASAKLATTGVLACASLFAAGRALVASDKLTTQYDFTATST